MFIRLEENNELRQRIAELEQQNLQLKKSLALSKAENCRNGISAIGLPDSEALFRAYVETANDMVCTVDLTGALSFVNSYGQRLLGWSEAELIGRHYLEFVAPFYREKTALAFAHLLQTGELTDFELVLQSKEGTGIYVAVNSRLLHRDGELIGGIGIARDIRERKRFDGQLQMFRKAVEFAYDSTVITDLDGWVKYTNPAAIRIFGYEPDDLVGQNAAIFYPKEMPGQSKWLIQQAIAGGWSGEVICQRKNGDRFPALVSVSPIYDENTQPTAVSMISGDITSQKEIQAELAVKNRELERVSRLKSAFLANMSHELRTPLTSILGLSSLLEQQVFGSLNEKQLLYIEQIYHSGEHLLSLINDVLDLSKVEAGQMILEMEPVSIPELCEATLALVSEQARTRHLVVHSLIPPHLNPLMADELRVRQMLLNLLSNAIKFSHPGGEIGLEVTTQAGEVHFTVWDQGIGIPADKQSLLFQPFQQLDSSLAQQHEGTGLGLALTRQLAELHGGTVEFESNVGEGSRFTIRLPLHPDSEPKAT